MLSKQTTEQMAVQPTSRNIHDLHRAIGARMASLDIWGHTATRE